MQYTEIKSARTDALQDFYSLIQPYVKEHYPNLNNTKLMQYLKINGIRGFLSKHKKIKLDKYDSQTLQDILIEEENKVKQPSSALLKYLLKRFAFFNKKFFRNRLTQLPMEIVNGYVARKHLAGFLHSNDKRIKDCKYLFAKKIFFSKEFTDIVLLHEMCHHAVFELDKKMVTKATAHGALWQKYMKICGLTPPSDFDTIVLDFEKTPNYKNMSARELFREAKQIQENIRSKNKRIRELIRRNKERAIQDVLTIFNPAINVLAKEFIQSGKITRTSQLVNFFERELHKSVHGVVKHFKKHVQDKVMDNKHLSRILLAEEHDWNVLGLYPEIDKELGFSS